MTYRVVFAKRFQSDGEASSLDPTAALDGFLDDGIVADKVFVEQFEPESKHSQEVMDEDDAFLGMAAAEVWEYSVIDERAKEFEQAIENSKTVMEFEVTDATSTTRDELTSNPLATRTESAEDGESAGGGEPTEGGSGVRAGDDGPAGQSTGDPSAGGLGAGPAHMALDETDGIGGEDTGGLDGLTIVSADDPNLGLTDYGDTEPGDWAANTGPTQTPGRGIASRTISDEGSTLAPDKASKR